MPTWEELNDMTFVAFRKWVAAYATACGESLSGREVKGLASRMTNEVDRILGGDGRTWSDPTPEAVFKKMLWGV